MKTLLPLITFLAALAALHHLDTLDAKIHQRPLTAVVASVLYDRPLTLAAVHATTGALVTITTFALSTAWRPLLIAAGISVATIASTIILHTEIGARPQLLASATLTTALIKSLLLISKKRRRHRHQRT